MENRGTEDAYSLQQKAADIDGETAGGIKQGETCKAEALKLCEKRESSDDGSALEEKCLKYRRRRRRLFAFGAAAVFSLLIVCGLGANLNLWGYLNPGNDFQPFPAEGKGDAEQALRQIKSMCFTESEILHKWSKPIRLKVKGSPGEKDIWALDKIIACFNEVPGFPGITKVESDENCTIVFTEPDNYAEYKELCEPEEYGRSFCSAYISQGAIQRAVIVIEPGGKQGYRNSVILHEMYHLLGFHTHTEDKNSILNTRGPVSGLSANDLLAFEMIYRPAVSAGATLEEFIAVCGK